MAARRLTDADYELMAEMRGRGCSYEQIGRKIGCSSSAVSWHCLRLAIDPPKPRALKLNYHLVAPMKRGNHIVRPYSPEEDAKIVALERQGKSDTEIGRELGRKANSIRGRLMTLARREERAEG
jgi:hypothetical protein